MFDNPRPRTKQASPESISGQRIAKAYRTYRPRHRAEDAARWLKGEVQIAPTVKLAARVFNVSVPSVVKARAMLDGHRHVGARKIHHNGNGSSTRLSDRVIDNIILEIGPDRVRHALDRGRRPTLPLQAAE